MIEPRDLELLAAAGIAAGEPERQLRLLLDPPRPLRLARACTPGDGVDTLSSRRFDELVARGAQARARGRMSKFVPASGAASRMFRSLAAVLASSPAATRDELSRRAEAGDENARDTVQFVASLDRLALAGPLASVLGIAPAALAARARREPIGPILDALLGPRGLDAARTPKALLPFHHAAEGARSAFVEQLFEGLGYLADEQDRARFHFTISPGSRPDFERELERGRKLIGGRAQLEVDFSEQSGATDTLALDGKGRPARDEGGRLLLRPAGHGALLGNLEASGGDLVVVKNIDNVLPEARHQEIARWQLALAGRLVELEERDRDRSRPLRVCGVVRNTGEPGGGPFWVGGAKEPPSPQIVEASQVDHDDPEQARIWASSTHFNPVDLVCSLRDADGRPYRLADFVDPGSSFVATRSHAGRALRVLERPGLWNGAMARWETHFVEMPTETFAPVKSVLDLAREAHAADL